MALKYQWCDGVRVKTAAKVVGPVLIQITKKYRNTNAAVDALIERARNPRDPLHAEFIWNDARAAHEQRRERARLLLRSIRIITPERKSIRAIVSVKQSNGTSRYYPRSVVMADPDLRQTAIQEALRLIRGTLDRYSDITELDDVRAAVDRVARSIPKGGAAA